MPSPIQRFVQRHAALSYFVLTFAISWGAVVLVLLSTGLVSTKEDFDRVFPLAVVMMVLGPSVSGLLLTGLVRGRSGFRELRSRLFRWRVGARWYAVALALAPLYTVAGLLALSLLAPELAPGIFTSDDKAPVIATGVGAALLAGFFEELGWTGFAVPELRRRHGATTTGLIVGLLWSAWHVLPKIWGSGAYGLTSLLPADLLATVMGLTGFRILMVWVHDRTDSLLVAMLMHASLTASSIILIPMATGALLVRSSLAMALVPWAIIAAVAVVRRGRPSSRPRQVVSAHA